MWGAVTEANGRKRMLYLFIYLGHAVWLVGSSFSKQGLTLGHGSESVKS